MPSRFFGVQRLTGKFCGETVAFVNESPPLARVRRLDGTAYGFVDAACGIVSMANDVIIDRLLHGDEDRDEVDFPSVIFAGKTDSRPYFIAYRPGGDKIGATGAESAKKFLSCALFCNTISL